MLRARHMFLRVAALTLLVTAACKSDSGTQDGGEVVQIDAQRFRVDLVDDEIALGGDAPLVTLVVFSDYACAPCGRTWKVMKNLVEDFGQDIRVVFRSYTVPGFGRGEQAAEAAFAAGAQGKFWEMHWRLFEHTTFDRPTLRAHAEAVGLDVDKFLNELDTGVHSAKRMQHRRQAKTFGIQGLPVVFVNGLFTMSYKDEALWHDLVAAEIQRAREMIKDGTPRASIYEAFMAGAVRKRVTEVDEAKKMRDALRTKQADSKRRVIKPALPGKRYAIRPGDGPSLGPNDAPVVIVEFLDFQCPFCRRAWAEELEQLIADHHKDVRLSVRHLPLEIHESALGAARASLAAHRQGKFWPFHDRLLEGKGDLGRSTYLEAARDLGMDEKRFARDLDDPKAARAIEDDMRLARRVGITGTPGFFVNGRFVNGFQPGVLATTVKEELEAARERMAQGVPREKVFEAALADALPDKDFPNP